jgi:hypothetical protein
LDVSKWCRPKPLEHCDFARALLNTLNPTVVFDHQRVVKHRFSFDIGLGSAGRASDWLTLGYGQYFVASNEFMLVLGGLFG